MEDIIHCLKANELAQEDSLHFTTKLVIFLVLSQMANG